MPRSPALQLGVPVDLSRSQTFEATAAVDRSLFQATGVCLALGIVVGRGDQQRALACDQRPDRDLSRRRPASACAEIKAFGSCVLQRGKAHRVDCRFGDAKARCMDGPEPEQHLCASGREPAPFRTALLPAGDGTLSVPMRGPHAAARTFA